MATTFSGTRLEVRLFGRPQLHVNGMALEFRGPSRAMSLLAYLLLNREQRLARDAVAFTIWPDSAEPEARAKLRDHLYILRANCLPATDDQPWIVADKRSIQWNPSAPLWLDLAEFECLASSPSTAADAVAVYTGDLALGLDDTWLDPLRERLRERQATLLLQLVDQCLEQNDLRRGLTFVQELLRFDPWREDGVRRLIALRHQLGDRAGAMQVYHDFVRRLQVELGVEPMPETQATYENVAFATEPLVTSLPVATEPRAGNLRSFLTTFVGREREMATLQALFSDRRLVTLTGSGGVGKTRLAIESARAAADRFPDGVWFVELAPVSDSSLFVSTVAAALGLRSSEETALVAALRGRRTLLILDNCEHLIDAAATVVEDLLGQCRELHVLATSREPLRVAGERTERLDSLGVPPFNADAVPSIAELRNSPAVRLFLDRASDVAPALRLQNGTEIDRRALATIARRLDGIPLAIELAAARTSGLSLDALARHLERRFTLLTGGSRTALPRQQTLQATLDWSYGLLTAREQQVLRYLGIFAGGWSLEAAGAVCASDPASDSQIADSLSSLVDKSLVVLEPIGSEPRYRLLETTRSYALEKLVLDEDRESVARRHAEYFAELAALHDTTWGSVDTAAMVAELTPELGNLRSALHWASELANDPNLGARLVSSLRPFFAVRSLNAEGVRWCEAALASLGPHPEPASEAALLLTSAAMIGAAPFFPRFHFLRSGHVDRFLAVAQRAVDLHRSLDDDRNLALALCTLAMHLVLADQLSQALATADEALATARRSRERLAISRALYAKSFCLEPTATDERTTLLREAFEMCRSARVIYDRAAVLQALGEVAFLAGDVDAALEHARACEATYHGLDAPGYVAQAQVNVAAYALALGFIDDALAAAQNALAAAERTNDAMIAAAAFQHLAGIAAARGEFELAARLLGVSDARRSAAPPRLFTEQSGYDRTKAILRLAIDGTILEARITEGQHWSRDRTLEEAEAMRSGLPTT